MVRNSVIEQPKTIYCKNGPQFISPRFLARCVVPRIELPHIQPGTPQQRVCEGFQRRVAGRLLERELDRESVRRGAQDRHVQEGVQ
jgi:hypothetical protein